MVTSTKKVPTRGLGSGGGFPGPNGKKPGGNGWHGDGDRSKRKFSPETYRITMWVLLAGVAMMFAALSSVYIMSSEEQRRPVSMPPMFFVSTVLILISSGTFQRAKRSLQQEKPRSYFRWLLATLALGCAFLVSQFVGWRELAGAGVYFREHPRSTFFYIFTALHAAHLIGGILLLFFLVIRRARRVLPLNTEKNSTWTSIVGIYWHAMDGIWIWLFLLLLIFK